MAQAEGKEAIVLSFFDPKPKPPVTLTGNQTLSPRKHQDKKIVISTPMSLGGNSVASQGNKQKQKLDDPPTLTNTSKAAEFEDAPKEFAVVPSPIPSNPPYTSDDLFPDSEH